MIWIVEDNSFDRDIYEMVLAIDDIVYFHSGEAAWESLQEHGCAGIDLVVTDDRLAGMMGLELIGKIRATPGGERVPVCIVAAPLSPEDRAKARGLGVAAVLEKPYTLAGWESIADRLLELRRSHD